MTDFENKVDPEDLNPNNHPGSWAGALQYWRLRERKTQAEAAALFGVSVRAYNFWERGKVEPMRLTPFAVQHILAMSSTENLRDFDATYVKKTHGNVGNKRGEKERIRHVPKTYPCSSLKDYESLLKRAHDLKNLAEKTMVFRSDAWEYAIQDAEAMEQTAKRWLESQTKLKSLIPDNY